MESDNTQGNKKNEEKEHVFLFPVAVCNLQSCLNNIHWTWDRYTDNSSCECHLKQNLDVTLALHYSLQFHNQSNGYGKEILGGIYFIHKKIDKKDFDMNSLPFSSWLFRHGYIPIPFLDGLKPDLFSLECATLESIIFFQQLNIICFLSRVTGQEKNGICNLLTQNWVMDVFGGKRQKVRIERTRELFIERNTRSEHFRVSHENQIGDERDKITGESAKSSHWVSDWTLSPDCMTCQESFPSPDSILSPSFPLIQHHNSSDPRPVIKNGI